MSKKDSLRTQGVSVLTDEELRELSRLLNKVGITQRPVRTRDGNEIDLLNINLSISGAIPTIAKWLHEHGVGLIDWLDR